MDKATLQAKVVSLRGQMNDLVATANKRAADQRNLTTEEETKFDGLKAELESAKRNIDRLVALEGENTLRTNPNAQIDPEADQGHNPLDVSEKDLSKYSLRRAPLRMINKQPVDGLEREISDEIAKRSGKSAQGFYLYGSAMSAIESRRATQRAERRDLTTSTGVGGINQTVLYQSFIDKLRHRTLVDKVGTRFMAGLVGKFYIPRQSGAGQAYWVGEEGAPTTSNQTIDQVALAPETLGAFTDVSRQFIEQTSLDAEAFVHDDLAKVLAIEIDRAAFAGAGTGNQPTGILHNGAISHFQRATPGGSILSWGDVVGLETDLAALDADMGSLSYVTNTKVRGLLKTTLRSNVAGAKYIWDDDNTINGYPAFAGNNIPSDIGAGDTEGGWRVIHHHVRELLRLDRRHVGRVGHPGRSLHEFEVWRGANRRPPGHRH